MKFFFTTLALMVITGTCILQAQTATDSWSFGFGLSYPRLYSVNITSLNSNYGAYLSLQRNFSENVGLRLKGGYSHLEGQWNDAAFNTIKESTSLITADLDLMYYPVPCAPVSPYIFVGIGGNYKDITNPQTAYPDDNKFGSQLNIGTGVEFKINPKWSLVTEFGYHITNNSELDGAIAPTELNGHDAYLVLSAGFNFFFSNGEPSKLCEPCEGMTVEMKDMTDYNRIEGMIEKHIPKEVIIEKQPVAVAATDNFVLIGVNFAFNKSTLLPESYPVLYNSAEMLIKNPDIKIEIQGYCDYIGSDAYNNELSLSRAETVKMFLVSKGISRDRITTAGYGKTNPIGDNKTEEGRAINRRIEFKIIK